MHIKHSITIAFGLATGLTFVPMISTATTTNGTLQATITITANCLVSSGNAALDFGSSASTATNAATANNGKFSVTCTNGAPYSIGLTPSNSSAAGAGSMTYGGNTIGYQLYQDSSLKNVWGSTTGTGGNTEADTGTGTSKDYTVYGKTTSTLNVPAGTYADTVTIAVNY